MLQPSTYAWQGSDSCYPVQRCDLSPASAIGDACTVVLAVALIGAYAVASLIDVRLACRSEREALSFIARVKAKKAVRFDVHLAHDAGAAQRALADLREAVA